MLRLLPLLALFGMGCLIPLVPIAPPSLSPAQDQALRSTLSAATSSSSSVSIPQRLCPEHQARAAPGEKCRPIPCGGQCREDQRCDEVALVPRCVDKAPRLAGPDSQ